MHESNSLTRSQTINNSVLTRCQVHQFVVSATPQSHQQGSGDVVSLPMDILSELPVEIAQNILGLVSPQDLLNCSSVSSVWRSLADCLVLWRDHCYKRGWYDTHYVDQNRTHYPTNVIKEADEGSPWPLNKWAMTFQIQNEIPLSWEKKKSMDYSLSPYDNQITVLSCDGHLLALGHADGFVSVLDVYRVPKLVTRFLSLLKGYKVLGLVIAGKKLVLLQSMLLQIYKEDNGTYVLVDAKSFEMGLVNIEILQRYNDTLDNFVSWYTSSIGSDRYSKERVASTIHFQLSGELIYVAIRDYQMVYVWSLIDGKRVDTIHIPSNTCKIRDFILHDNKLYIIYASRNVRHITAYHTRKREFIFEVTTPDCKTQKVIVDHFLVGIAISGPGLTTAGVIKVWEKDTGKQIASRNTAYISCKTVNTLYDLIIFSERTTVYVWEPSTDSIIKTVSMEDTVIFLCMCPYKFVLVYTDRSCWLCDWVQGSKLYRLYPQHVKSGDYRGLVYSDDTMILIKTDVFLIQMISFC